MVDDCAAAQSRLSLSQMAVAGQPSVETALRELVAIYHHLTGLALQSADVQTVASLLAERTVSDVAVMSPTLEVLATAGSASDEQTRERIAGHRLGRVLGTVAQTRRALRLPGTDETPSVVVAPVVVGNEILAYLLTVEEVTKELGEDVSLLVTEHAATICGVIMGRERVAAAAAGRVRNDLVEGLLVGHASDRDELHRWAQHLGYDAAHTHRVISVEVEPATLPGAAAEVPGAAGGAGGNPDIQARNRRIFDCLAELVVRRVPDAIVATRDSEMVIVAREKVPSVDAGRLSPAELGAGCQSHAGRLFPDALLTVGIGGACRDPSEIARAYSQARRTIATMRRMGRQGQVIAFEDLGLHRLLLQVPDLNELRSFADEVMGPLAAHERQHRSGYLKTLAVYLRENGSLQRAARRLHVHPNTVTYRLNRVESITGLDLDRYQDRLTAQVALEIVDALEDRPRWT